jgi:hypothetical protein
MGVYFLYLLLVEWAQDLPALHLQDLLNHHLQILLEHQFVVLECREVAEHHLLHLQLR